MIKSIKIFFKNYFKLYLFWFAFFTFCRVLFLISYGEKIEGSSFSEIASIFYYSFRLDFATASVFVVPLLMYGSLKEFLPKLLTPIFKTWFLLTVIYSVLIHSGELNVYEEWNHKLSSRIFTHLGNPDEVARTAELKHFFLFIFYLVLESGFAYLLWRILFKGRFFKHKESRLTSLYHLLNLTCIAISLVGIRGGLQPIPININSAMFSNNYVINDIAVNSSYFSTKDFLLFNRGNIASLYPKMDEEEVKERVRKLYKTERKHSNIFLKKNNVNIVVVLLESWSANAVSTTSELENTTPNFDSLAANGYLFDNVYSCGWTSEIGNSSTFSGYPALPEISVTMQSDKSRSLPSINQDLRKKGYYSSYIFSGDLKYGNIGGYLLNHGFDQVKDELDFPKSIKERGKLNYYDSDLYDFLISEINSTKEPFLHCAFTGSTHSPFDQPIISGREYTGQEESFMNALIYADASLGEFMEKAQKEDWYSNTLFVFMADHGHAAPDYRNPSKIDFFRIPMLFYGDVIKQEYRGKRNSVIGSQSDFAKTLLTQLGMSTERYPWSKDLMDPSIHPFALHTLRMGYGYLSNEGNYSYYFDTKREYVNEISEEGKLNSYALINGVFKDFENR